MAHALTIEAIVSCFGEIAPARGKRWNVHTLIEGRLHLTRSEDALFALFVEGSKDSFGSLPANTALQHSDDVIGLPVGRKFSALRVIGSNVQGGDRVLAHIAYELLWTLGKDPSITNDSLVQSAGWLFSLLANSHTGMSVDRQKGLASELLFLRMLLHRGSEVGRSNLTILESWTGPDQAKRDFFGPNIAVEVKATANATRLHLIGSLDQLAPHAPNENVYLFSVGLRQDPSAPRKITHYVADIEAMLVDARGEVDQLAVSRFRELADKYGFRWSDRDIYERSPGFLAPHLPPTLFREVELRRLKPSDFVGGRVPETVRSISYWLEVVATPLRDSETSAVLNKLLGIDK